MSTSADSKLFRPLQVGRLNLAHRLILAPLTRFRSDENHVPLPFVAEYYEQRACVPGTLLITEATFISPRASGMANVPGIWTKEQIQAWKSVTDAVHKKGSYIYCQLWALGRAANVEFMAKRGLKYVSSSPSAMPGDSRAGTNPPPPQALSEEEIQEFIQDYAQAARNSIEAGFDGIEIHGANGYLIDQFNQDRCNTRTDRWGGSVENRSRFALAVTKAVVDAVGADRTGIRLSPFSVFQGMRMQDPIPQFSHIAKGLKELKLAYLHVVESRIAGNADVEPTEGIDFLLDIWKQGPEPSPFLAAGGFKPASALTAVDEEYRGADVCIVFGRLFISTPDLCFRIKHGIEPTQYDRKTFYKAKSKDGYTDYPFSREFLEEARSSAKL